MLAIIPNCYSLSQLLTVLCDKEITVDDADIWNLEDKDVFAIASFRAQNKFLASLVLMDYVSAVCLASIVARTPTESILKILNNSKREFTPELNENLKETFNIFSTLLNMDGYPHISIHDVLTFNEELPEQLILSLSGEATERADFKCNFNECGIGKLTYIVTSVNVEEYRK